MKYIIEFSKTGTICYTSHLDIMKVFKRSFKRAGISIAYSQGFNPHPKMGFAQPLSLGYWGLEEYVEFETAAADAASEPFAADEMLQKLSAIMPEGLTLKRIIEAPWLRKTLAAETTAAEYMIQIPDVTGRTAELDGAAIYENFMNQEEILVLKKQKKKPEPVLVDIKSKIRSLQFQKETDTAAKGQTLHIDCILDAGSESNLSPELLIEALVKRFGIETPRCDMDIARKRLYFKDETEQKIR
ncbi:MAG: DUF2344 domain-containing protein [Firmicutes bacterium]|nr:DUF2344 domain-containing protein [Bacillota bacterium]